MRVQHSHRALRIVTVLMFFCVSVIGCEWAAEASVNEITFPTGHWDGSLAEIKDKHSMALVIIKSSVIDASGADETIIREALAAEPRLAVRHRFAYGVIAKKLNQYIRKYRNLRPADRISQADFVVYFKLVEYRRTLNGIYPYGELYVIVNPPLDSTGAARIIWRTKKLEFAEDAIKNLLRDLKQVRGER